ncbi:MAG: ammonia-forming cytochrome c nitrite reductase subunit c552 [Burkholderiales bacterium]|nr:ammonia-forming cytochrome c nitrite reductase subunit c552 [Burkholderiales bacterium]
MRTFVAALLLAKAFCAGAADYVGGKVCGECHAKAYEAWRGSHHDLAMQEADARTVLGNFANAKFAYAGITSTFFKRDGKYYVNTDGPDGKLADFPIKYTFGVTPLQQYLIELPGGRLQALSIAWDSRPKAAGGQRWFHLYPKQGIKAGDPLHWTGIGQNWNFMCSECHSTNLRKGYDAQTGTYRTTWSEIDVSCEACHGPGSAHVAWAKTGTRTGNNGLALALDERKGVTWTVDPATGKPRRSAPRTSAREIEICARCHARAARLADDYVPGKPLLDTHRPALLEDGLYWIDGQMRDEVYNWGSFLQSRMYAAGVTCSDCHDPHSLELRAPGNAVCGQCHAAAKYDAPAHTHHQAGMACASCHMPATTYMVVDPRHDHSLRIPRPDVSARLGTPNACNNCHTKQDAAWAAAAIAKWTNAKPGGFQNFADAMQRGTAGAPGGRGALMTLAADKAQPALVRASALARLGAWLTPVTLDTFARALNDPDPVVRMAAVEALAAAPAEVRLRYLPRMAADPVRAVRVATARALAGPTETRVPQEHRAALAKAMDEYVATLTYNADRPESRLGLGALYAARGDRARAVAEYEKAIALDPTFVPAYANLADLLRDAGDEAAAQAALRRGLAREPKAAALHHALGLSLVRQKQGAQALDALAAASRLEPANARYAYVYAVALHDLGQPKKARDVLAAALARSPYDRELLSTLVLYALQAGDREAARGYVKRLREVEPDDPGVARLVAQVEAVSGR